MLEKPVIKDETIISCLLNNYNLNISEIRFLPLGADLNTAVYRADTNDHISYFVKLRKHNFDSTSVLLPKFLSEQNVSNIIAPIANQASQLWSEVELYKLILYPFIYGWDGFHIDLSEKHWFEFGTALKKLHTIKIPEDITNKIQRETYSPQARETTKRYLQKILAQSFADQIANDVAEFLKTKRGEILHLVEKTERLALKLQVDSPPFTICHSDVHAGNIFIDDKDHFYIVDWDNPILAPKERDLMFIGGAQGFRGHSLEEEEVLFYRGYGKTEINQVALSYYRHERIVQDIAIYCKELLLSVGSPEDREQSFEYLKSNFKSGGTIDIAYTKDKTGI